MPRLDGTITLETLGDGAAAELFQREFDRVLRNIQDPNTSPTAARSVTLKVTVKPRDEARDEASLAIDISSKLASPKPALRRIYMGQREGRLVAVDHDPRQRGLFDDERDDDSTVLPLDRQKKTEGA